MSACEYACALVSQEEQLLLELRPATARRAPGRLTCFGGACEDGEAPAATLIRELDEELGWQVSLQRLQPAVDLYKGRRWVARFFSLSGPFPQDVSARQRGHRALWIPWAALAAAPVSPWHAAVLDAWRRGQARVDLLLVRSEARE